MIIAVMQISCGRDRKFLTVRENDDGELSYSMQGAGGGTSFSLNNLQVKQPLPRWRDEPVDVCLQEVGRIVEEGVYRVHSVEKPPSRASQCPRCAELKEKLDESRKLGLYWQAEAERLMEIIEEEVIK